MAYTYDHDNVFARILRGEIPNRTVLETAHTLAFHDIGPQAPVHVLVIPKGAYVTFDHFAAEASDAEIVDFTRTAGAVCEHGLGVQPGAGGEGYRTIANAGAARRAGGAALPSAHPRRPGAGADARARRVSALAHPTAIAIMAQPLQTEPEECRYPPPRPRS